MTGCESTLRGRRSFPVKAMGAWHHRGDPFGRKKPVGQVANWSVSDDHLFPTNRSEQMINKVRVEHQAFLFSDCFPAMGVPDEFSWSFH